MSTKTKKKTEWDNLTDGLWQIYEKLGNGEQAELRRGLPSEPFWRMLAYIGKEDAHPNDLWKWRVLIQCIAISGYSDTPFGIALQKADYSEARLKRLLEADDDLLPGILRRTAKQLKSADETGNWNAIRRLLFDYDGKDAERVRLQIAQQFYTNTYDDTTNQDDNSDE
jgi:CRISPR system Cascade subunit CasB